MTTLNTTATTVANQVVTKAVSAVNILKSVMLFQIEVHIWSGAQVLKGQDLTRVDKDDLPPPFLASLGSKKLIDVTHLKIFTTLKRQAERILESAGIEFMGGYAISLSKVDAVAAELDAIEQEFEVEKKAFLANYDHYIAEWIALNPDWKHALELKPVPVENVTISFTWLPTVISAPTTKKNLALINRCNSKVEGLSDKLFADIAKESNDVLEKAFSGRDRVSQTTITRLTNIKEKLEDLSFINTSTTYLVQAISYILTLMPPSGHIDGAPFNALYQLFELLSSPEKMAEFGELCVDGVTAESLISEHCTYVQDSVLQVKPAQKKQPKSKSVEVAEQPNLFDMPAQNVAVANVIDEAETIQASAEVVEELEMIEAIETNIAEIVIPATKEETIQVIHKKEDEVKTNTIPKSVFKPMPVFF